MPTPEPSLRVPPSTRYQGSKRKLLPWLWDNLRNLDFDTALDAFGGTGAVSYLLKSYGKAVTYNDYLHCNALVGKALIENPGVQLRDEDLNFVLATHPRAEYDDFIARTFAGIYFTGEENAWLDRICQNIPRLSHPYRQAMAYYALFQACLIKRPYNLFHRCNLTMRTATVPRGFGNKASWDAPFETRFRAFVTEANHAVFDSGVLCQSLCTDALEVPGRYDLVYIDTPYINSRGTGTDYHDYYHFLEGMVHYPCWNERVDYTRKHRPLRGTKSVWGDRHRVADAFTQLFDCYADSILVVSYRSDGIPSQDELAALMRRVKRHVRVVQREYQYALSKPVGARELLIIGM